MAKVSKKKSQIKIPKHKKSIKSTRYSEPILDELHEIRRKNLILVLNRVFEGKQVKFADAIDVDPADMSRFKKGTKIINDTIAQRIERRINKAAGWFDKDLTPLDLENTTASHVGITLVTSHDLENILNDIDKVCERRGFDVSTTVRFLAGNIIYHLCDRNGSYTYKRDKKDSC
jgi:hypothetical protein